MKIFAFIGYLLKDIFGGLYTDLREMFEVVTKKKTWVVFFFVAFLVALVWGNFWQKVIFGAMFLFFFITYEWQVFTELYIHQQRTRYWRKPKA